MVMESTKSRFQPSCNSKAVRDRLEDAQEMESQSTLEPCFCSLSTPTLVDGLPVALDPK
jgi:pyrimidine deaminase RibD-like protein